MGRLIRLGGVTVAFFAGILVGTTVPSARASSPDVQPTQVFELRTYTAADGKHEALLSRFRDHTLRIFEKHGMTNVGYWTPQDPPGSDNTLVYLLAHPSRAAADENWQAFIADPEWQGVFEASRSDGPLIEGLQRTFLDPTDFSPMR